jgi:enamine deaminase RidA (YjgF/YER057c/UK114 family)
VRRGSTIAVSGTTASSATAAAHPDDTGCQTRDALHRAIAAIARLGGTIDDVVRTRVMLAPRADWEAAAVVHGELFGSVAPANTTCYVGGLIGDHFLVEVELDAIVEGDLP